MNARSKTLPLGVDIGSSRIRVALLECDSEHGAHLIAVAARSRVNGVAEALREMVAELQTKERRCIVAMAPPDATLATVDFPHMTPWERRSAARFEAARLVGYPIGEADVSIVRTSTPQRWVLGIVRRAALTALIETVTQAGLAPVAVDDVAFALRRTHPDAGGTIDIGEASTRLTLFGAIVPNVVRIPVGGTHFTSAIAQSLGIELGAAEERKRNIGFAGAGEAQRDVLASAIGTALMEADAAGYAGPRRMVVCGNGSRVPGLTEAIERACGHAVIAATLPPDVSGTLPPDVLRAAGADWSVAYGLALWNLTA